MMERRSGGALEWQPKRPHTPHLPPASECASSGRTPAVDNGADVWRERLRSACRQLEAGAPEQITCLLPMARVCSRSEAAVPFLKFLLDSARRDSAARSGAHPMAMPLIAEVLVFVRETVRPVGLAEQQEARELAHRIYALQPGFKRVWVHATRRRGKDSLLLMAESILLALYDVFASPSADANYHGRHWDRKTPVGVLSEYGFYKTCAYFVARWDKCRYRMDKDSASRIRLMLEWWTANSKS